jgi:cell surface protein SprA
VQRLENFQVSITYYNPIKVIRLLTLALADPSSDKYHFFRGSDYDGITDLTLANTLHRYKKYNNAEGNSPTEQQYPDAGIPSAATNNPNIEDINKDNTLSETENYYQYKISKFLLKI